MAPVGIVYLIVNTANGKKYVGCTKGTPERRWGRHCTEAQRGSRYAIHAAIRKYGPRSFTLSVLETVNGAHLDLMAAEVRQISAHGSVVPHGYNLTLGGGGVDHLVPSVRERHIAANKKLYADPAWHRATIEGARKRSSNPEWKKNQKEAAVRCASDPVWREKHQGGIRKLFSDPLYLTSLAEGIRKRTEDPKWNKAVVVAAQARVRDPAWQKANVATLTRAHTAASAKAVANDARFSPEVQARRVRRREQGRLRAAAKRERRKMTQSAGEEQASRERQRAANKRCYQKRKNRGPVADPL
jgi:hypothetical protein